MNDQNHDHYLDKRGIVIRGTLSSEVHAWLPRYLSSPTKCILKTTLLKQIGNIESIKFDIKDGDFVKLITAKDLQDNNIKNNFQPENEADEKFVEEIVCSKEGFSSVFS